MCTQCSFFSTTSLELTNPGYNFLLHSDSPSIRKKLATRAKELDVIKEQPSACESYILFAAFTSSLSARLGNDTDEGDYLAPVSEYDRIGGDTPLPREEETEDTGYSTVEPRSTQPKAKRK